MTGPVPGASRTRGPASPARSRGAAITILLSLPALAGCGGSGDEESPPAPPSATRTAALAPPTAASPGIPPRVRPPDPARVDHSDATAVSRAAVLAMWRVDSAVDTGQRDAYRRARPFLTPEYFATVRGEQAGKLPNEWLRHRAYATVRLAPQQIDSGAGADTPTTAHRQWGITVVPVGRDGWRGRKVEAVAFVTLTRAAASAPWRVSMVTTG